MDRKREAFDKWAVANLGSMATEPHPGPEELLLMEMAWSAYQQAYDDMYPVFDRIDELMKNDCQLYEPEFDTKSAEWDLWLMMDGCVALATGKTFRELCVNLIMADGRDEK